jgi:peptidyl-dipeptidase A
VTADPQQLVTDLEARLRPLEIELARAWWASNTAASPETEQRRTDADLAHRSALADAAAFSAVRDARDDDGLDPVLRRQLDVLHDAYVPHQLPDDVRRRLVELETAVETTYNTFRGELDGEKVDDNAILEILRSSDDVGLRRRAWEASKQIGAEVADQVRELARLRNEAARSLGYRDHFALALATGELEEDRLFATLDEVDRQTVVPFTAWKADLDDALAARFSCSVDELRPWHLDEPFFQDPPTSGAVDLDPVFADRDLVELTLRTYDGLGLDATARASTRSASTSTARATCACCATSSRTSDGWTRCSTSSGTASTTVRCGATCPGSCGTPPTRSPPRVWP